MTASDSQQQQARHESGRIARAVAVLSSATLLSRVLGLLRDIVVAALFGVGGSVDAFFVAFRLPNTLRRLFAEGSLTVAFVPVFVEVSEREGEQRAHQLARRGFTLLGAVLALVVLAGMLGAPWIVRLTAWGFTKDPAKFALTVQLTRAVFPFLGLIGLTALAGGILNAWGIFSYPALAPVLLNACMIATALTLSGWLEPPIASLAVGVLLGGVLQLVLQGVPLGQRGFRFRPEWQWRDPALLKVARLMGPTVFGVAVYQVNILVSTLLASWLPDGSISYLYYAERLFQLPLGVFAVAVGTASLPSLSRLAARGDAAVFRDTLGQTLRMSAFIVVPAAAGLLVLARPILVVLLQRGAFDAAAVEATARALTWYALALIPVAGVRVLAPAFYALQDTRTPVMAAFWSLWVNLAASLVLMVPLQHAGLALATGVSSAFNLGYLLWKLRAATGHARFTARELSLGRVLLATGAMLVPVLWGTAQGSWGGGSVGDAGLLAVLVLGGGVVYLGSARILGLDEARLLTTALRRRLRRG
ncbi:MAG: murein biosynthesis integral membrane protein MurJ [Deferrisomatales bacterium]|nr:murein biosynthesis integral membrane protein MurJ [Deferrisomatales bacterium]